MALPERTAAGLTAQLTAADMTAAPDLTASLEMTAVLVMTSAGPIAAGLIAPGKTNDGLILLR